MNYYDVLFAKKLAGGGGSAPVLIEKDITENGTYSASDDDADGYSSVTVDIPEKEITFSNQPVVFALSSNIENEMDVIIPNGITIINERAFLNCSALKSVVIPDTVTKLSQYCFYGCAAIKEVDIPNSVTRIDSNCFTNCTALKTVTIGSGIAQIGAQNFTGCTALETVTINKPEGSISGAPWGAPSTTQIIWAGDSNERTDD